MSVGVKPKTTYYKLSKPVRMAGKRSYGQLGGIGLGMQDTNDGYASYLSGTSKYNWGG
jgi:hypothetical protein